MHKNPGTLVVLLALLTYSMHTAEAMRDLEEAEMGGPAQGSALEGLTSSAWREIAEISGRTADELYTPLCFIENDVTDTQVIFYYRTICQAGPRQNVYFGIQEWRASAHGVQLHKPASAPMSSLVACCALQKTASQTHK